jgi:hypothetical protein
LWLSSVLSRQLHKEDPTNLEAQLQAKLQGQGQLEGQGQGQAQGQSDYQGQGRGGSHRQPGLQRARRCDRCDDLRLPFKGTQLIDAASAADICWRHRIDGSAGLERWSE